MLQIWFPLSLILISLIFIRMPKEISGLINIFNSTDSFIAPSQLEIILDILIGFGVLVFIIIAFKLNINI